MNFRRTGWVLLATAVLAGGVVFVAGSEVQQRNRLPVPAETGTPLPVPDDAESFFGNEIEELQQEMNRLRQEMYRMMEEQTEWDLFEGFGPLFRIAPSPQQQVPGWKVQPDPNDRPVGRLHRRMDDLLQQFEKQAYGNVVFRGGLDLQETPSHYVVVFEAGEIGREQIEVRLEGRRLTVEARQEERQESEQSDESAQSTIIRSFSGHFQQSIELPGPVDASRIQTDYKNGVLMILLPRVNEES